ncbi:MAG: hypothetical protein AAGM22_07355 [Acidobacteriota bacterium]
MPTPSLDAPRRTLLILLALPLLGLTPTVGAEDEPRSHFGLSTPWVESPPAEGQTLPASSISAGAENIYRGDVVTLDIVVSNPAPDAKRYDVEATLGIAVYFADASHGGELIDPDEAPQTRGVAWRGLDLPANSSGRLQLTVVLRPDDAGDMVVDVEARDVLSADDPVQLNFHRPLTDDPLVLYGPVPTWIYVIFFGMPASLLLFAVLRASLGPKHRITQYVGRTTAVFGAALVGGVIGYGIIQGIVDSYMGATETTCAVLDRRAELFTMQSSSSSSGPKSSQTYYQPLIAAEYQSTKDGERKNQIAVGFSSDMVSPNLDALRDYKIGDEVRCWHDNEWPNRFFVVRGYDLGSLFFFGFAMLISAALLFVAFRPWRS